MKYDDALEQLNTRTAALGSRLGLDCMTELLRRTGNPEKDLKVIHVAGTNGKGSVSSFLAGALQANGYRVGRYISPAVLDYRERIQVNGVYIPKVKVEEYLSALFEASDSMVADGFLHPTAFEIETVMAFQYLRDKNCDFCVIEVGMGGREDATNVIEKPLLCVITSVSLDHVGMIGNNLEEIAETKAGIIKDGTVVVSAPQEESVLKVLKKECAKHAGANLIEVDRADVLSDFGRSDRQKAAKPEGRVGSAKEPGTPAEGSAAGTSRLPARLTQRFSYKAYKKVELSMLGEFQPENASVALEAVEALKNLGIKINDEKTRKGLKETKWPARFEILGKKPLVIADGAHNPDAVLRLMKTVDYYFTNCPIIYIMGVLKDKAAEEIVSLSVTRAAAVITITPPNNKRGMPAFELAQIVREVNPNVSAADSVEEALEEAVMMAGEQGVILAFGSLSYQGKLRDAYDLIAKQSKKCRDGAKWEV